MIPIETLRVRVGLEPDDASRDDDINGAMAVATALAEAYLDRRLAYKADEVETLTHYKGFVISLKRYPVCNIESIEVEAGGVAPEYHLESLNGLLHIDGMAKNHRLKITYEGGYHEDTAGDPCPFVYPADLKHGVLLIFDQVWTDTENSGGMSSENVQSITIMDVGTIRWGSDGAGGAGGEGSVGFISPTAVAILNPYRREQC